MQAYLKVGCVLGGVNEVGWDCGNVRGNAYLCAQGRVFIQIVNYGNKKDTLRH